MPRSAPSGSVKPGTATANREDAGTAFDGPNPAAVLGARERQRRQRRGALIAAARELLAEGKSTGFSMLALAERASVSPATPYNLFGSKAAVLREVFAAEVTGFHRSQTAAIGRDPIRSVLSICDTLATEFCRRPAFYQALAASLASVEETGPLFVPLAQSLLVPFVEALKASGSLQPWVSGIVIGNHLMHVIEVLFFNWTTFAWSQDRLALELRVGVGITFVGLLVPELQHPLVIAIGPAIAELERLYGEMALP